MSVVYCTYCQKNIDTDFNAEHFPDEEGRPCEQELEDDPPTCSGCDGSGMGRWGERSRCTLCGGSGTYRRRK